VICESCDCEHKENTKKGERERVAAVLLCKVLHLVTPSTVFLKEIPTVACLPTPQKRHFAQVGLSQRKPGRNNIKKKNKLVIVDNYSEEF
jgi:hypothetical protein